MKNTSLELSEMVEKDQTMRNSGVWDQSIDEANTKRVKEIVEKYGWPTITKLGTQASHDAWLLVQHANDLDFQVRCLTLMKQLPPAEVDLRDIAYLEDRVLVNQGRLQIYGTQFKTDAEGRFAANPIEDQINLEARRAAIGLGPYTEYEKMMLELNTKNESKIEDT